MPLPAEPPAPLEQGPLHLKLGAVLGADGDYERPLHYGDPEAEHRALRAGAALVLRSWTSRLEVSGSDRHRFVNGLVTCEVKSLDPGASAYGFVTSAKGRILADVTVLALADRLWLELPPARGTQVRSHLEKYVITDDVDMGPLTEAVPIALAGPRGIELAGEVLEGLPAEDGGHRPVDLGGLELLAHRGTRHGLPLIDLWTPAAALEAVLERLLDSGLEGLRVVGETALERVRIESGVPRFGVDFGPENLPQETGLEQAVSYTKGCYLGQEVVARIHYRGGVRRSPRGLLFATSEPPAAGQAIHLDGQAVGRLGSVARSPRLGMVGLALLHERATDPGTVVTLEDGSPGTVATLPFEVS